MWQNSVVKGPGRFWYLPVIAFWRKLCWSLSIDRDETWGNKLSSLKVSLSYFIHATAWHTHIFFFFFLFTSERTADLKIQKNHCFVVYATTAVMQKMLGLPGSTQPCKVKMCNTKPPCMYAIVFLYILLPGHAQSKRCFLHCGTQYCMRFFIAGTWFCSHRGAPCLVPLLGTCLDDLGT